MTVPFVARRSMAATAFESRLYLFGGVGANTRTETIRDVSNDLWIYDVTDASWSEVPLRQPWPDPRRCVGFTAMEAELLLWGGSGVTDGRVTWLSDLWRFDMRQRLWTESNADQKPEARYTPVFEAVDGEVFLFSGYTQRDGAGVVLDDSWLLRDSEWTRVRAANRPSARYGTTSARGERGVAVFGGFDGTRDLADLWLFDLCARDWINLAPASPDGPSPRYCAAAAVYGRRLALFGGRSRAHPKRNYNDLWVFDLELAKWELVEANREPHVYGTEASYPGYHAKSAVAVLDRAMYLWGGEGRDGHVSDLWRLDLRDLTWQQLAGARSDDPKLW